MRCGKGSPAIAASYVNERTYTRPPAHYHFFGGTADREEEARMDTLDTRTWMMLGGVLIVALFAVVAWLIYQKKQSQTLKQRFGPEYQRTVGELDSQSKAEAE